MLKKLITFLVLFISVCGFTQNGRTVTPFDDHWKFYKGDAPGAEAISFNTSNWSEVKLPHDWSIEGPYDRNNPT